jgi:hypothetical protein
MEQLRLKIKERLEKVGFAYNEQTSTWSKIQMQQVNGGTISINGQVMQQPPTTITLEMNVSDLGECTVTDVKSGKDDISILLQLQVFQNKELIQHLEINLYNNEYKMFDDLVTKIFNV